MKLKIIEKLTIWTLSFFIVVSFLFIQVRIDFDYLSGLNQPIEYNHTIDSEPMFKLIDVVSIQSNDEMFEVVDASLLATVIFYVASSVFISLGAYYTTEFILANANAFTSWYVDWYNTAPTLENPMTEQELAQWQKAHEIPDYLEATGQLNLDGTLKDPDNIVLMNDYLANLYSSSKYYLDEYLDKGGIKWMNYNYDGVIHMLPHINGYVIYEPSEYPVYSTLKIIGQNSYPINKNQYSVKVTEHLISENAYRLKMTLTRISTNTIYAERYSDTLTKLQRDTIIQSVGYMHNMYRYNANAGDAYLQLIPLYWNLDLEDSLEYAVLFKYNSISSTTVSKVTFDNSLKINTTNLINITYNDIDLNENGLPVGYDDDISDYYNIPIVDVTDNTPNPLPPTPVPVEEWPDYTYNPPTPGVGNPDWTDLVNPPTSAPTATPENTLSGGIFQALGDWFVSIFYGAINAVMGFFKAVLINMSTMISDLFDWWKELIPDNWYDDFWDNFLTNMSSLFIPTDLDLKFNTLLAYFEDKFGLLFYGIEVLINFFDRIVNTTPRDSIQLFAFSIDGIQIIPAYEFNFTDFASQNEFLLFLYQAMKSIITALFILGFFYGVYSKYESMRDH